MANTVISQALELATHIAATYQLTSMQPLLQTCHTFAAESTLTIATFGRFKSGKSSLLNSLLRRQLLPVGVVPVTSVVTQIGYGTVEYAEVSFLDGRCLRIGVEEMISFITEQHNPENSKQVSSVRVYLPSLRDLAQIRFVDTPGLDSVLAHNTQSALEWLPNVGLAFVTISVDPPLSQQDVHLIRELYEYTPNVTIVLSKADLVAPPELQQIAQFVREQLIRILGKCPTILPYSVKPEHEQLRKRFEDETVLATAQSVSRHHVAVLNRKTSTLLSECEAYLTLALRSSQTCDEEREALKSEILGETSVLSETKLSLRVMMHHIAGKTRRIVESELKPEVDDLAATLVEEFQCEFGHWASSIAAVIDGFEKWLHSLLPEKLVGIEAAHHRALLEPIQSQSTRIMPIVREFRNRMSAQTEKAFGVSLSHTEIRIEAPEVQSPDVSVGKVFDRNWELLSSVIPMWAVRGLVRRHLIAKLRWESEKNISRLTSQWEQIINAALLAIQNQAEQRLDEYVATVESLLSMAGSSSQRIRDDLNTIQTLRRSLSAQIGPASAE